MSVSFYFLLVLPASFYFLLVCQLLSASF